MPPGIFKEIFMDSDQVVKVMLNLSRDICERSQQLTGYLARNSLRGAASRADVMRAAISIGLDILDKRQAKEEGEAA
jgi:hypothetical protein